MSSIAVLNEPAVLGLETMRQVIAVGLGFNTSFTGRLEIGEQHEHDEREIRQLRWLTFTIKGRLLGETNSRPLDFAAAVDLVNKREMGWMPQRVSFRLSGSSRDDQDLHGLALWGSIEEDEKKVRVQLLKEGVERSRDWWVGHGSADRQFEQRG